MTPKLTWSQNMCNQLVPSKRHLVAPVADDLRNVSQPPKRRSDTPKWRPLQLHPSLSELSNADQPLRRRNPLHRHWSNKVKLRRKTHINQEDFPSSVEPYRYRPRSIGPYWCLKSNYVTYLYLLEASLPISYLQAPFIVMCDFCEVNSYNTWTIPAW